MTHSYYSLLTDYQRSFDQLSRQSRRLAILRFMTALTTIFFLFQYFKNDTLTGLAVSVVSFIAFVVLVKKHQQTDWEKRLKDEGCNILKDEIAQAEEGQRPFANGKNFTKTTHPYTYDLDIFGEHSLYQYLNRTGTQMGADQLAYFLQSGFDSQRIAQNQQAAQELAKMEEWRLEMLALTRIQPDSAASFNTLQSWLKNPPGNIQRLILWLARITPWVTAPLIMAYFVLGQISFWHGGLMLFFINLALLSTQTKKILQEIVPSMQIDKILHHYALMLEAIENTDFNSERLIELQKSLTQKQSASEAIHQLSKLFSRMDHVQNIFASPLLNGLFCYHIHQLHALYKWRGRHAAEVDQWLQTLGEIEALSSIANFHYTHPDFAYPTLNNEKKIHFQALGHPLIRGEERICNDVSFQDHRFVILTGSNMSGKSTFLRTLGVNMVLANMGAPICATQATFHPMQVLASMRQADSLSDSTSLFYAEIKRLKFIIESLQGQPGFVLLDEILRGTNSDDKQLGTLAMIQRMIELEAIGIIATHDLEVCQLTDQHPDTLTNKRFEVETKEGELHFDYLLKDGICENKSATFLMKKMGIY